MIGILQPVVCKTSENFLQMAVRIFNETIRKLLHIKVSHQTKQKEIQITLKFLKLAILVTISSTDRGFLSKIGGP